MDTWMDERVGRRTDKCTDRWMDEQMNGFKCVMNVHGISLHRGAGGDWEERWTAD